MSRLEAPSEPSMEEILAQIRKIIADEPVQARAEHAQLAAQRRAAHAPRPQQPPAPATSAPIPAEPTSPTLDAIARLESVLNAPQPTPAPDDDLSDLVEPMTPAEVAEAAPARDAAMLPNVQFDAPAFEPVVSEVIAVPSAPAPGAAAPEPAVEVGEAVLAQPSAAEPTPPVVDAMETALDTLAAGLAAVSAKAAPETPAVAEVEQVNVTPPSVSVEAVAEPVAPPLPITAAEPVIDLPAAAIDTAVDTAPEREVTAAAPNIEATQPDDAAPIDLPAPAVTSLETVAAVVEPMVALDAVEPPSAEEAPAPTAATIAAMPVDETALPAEPMPATEVVENPVAAAFAPVLAADEASAPAAIATLPDPQPSLAQEAAPAPAAETDENANLEDAMADLLRPMLRQWLDEHMPRIVERALRVEMAQLRKPKK